MKIQAVIIMSGDDYVIHGSAKQKAPEMFKSLLPLWDFDPITDTAHFVEVDVELPPEKLNVPLAD